MSALVILIVGWNIATSPNHLTCDGCCVGIHDQERVISLHFLADYYTAAYLII